MQVRRIQVLAAVMVGVMAASSMGAVVLPTKAYVKPDEPILVKFLNEKGDEGKKAVERLGAAAAKLDDLFTPVANGELTAAGSFKVYSATGEPIAIKAVKATDEGTVDLSATCPQVKEAGTYYLVWKDAPPLVIETLSNPGRGPAELARFKPQLDSMPADARAKQMASFGPAVTHLELAQIAEITTDKGVIKAKFSYEVAPHTVDNFITLARQGLYDGTTFHRIIAGFMIQGGDPWGNMDTAGMGGPGYEITKEFSEKKHEAGTLSMARSSDPNSAGSQFFIIHKKSPHLDGQYSAFGDVFEGMDVVNDIATKTPSEQGSGAVKGPKPKIVSIRILPGTADIYGLKK